MATSFPADGDGFCDDGSTFLASYLPYHELDS